MQTFCFDFSLDREKVPSRLLGHSPTCPTWSELGRALVCNGSYPGLPGVWQEPHPLSYGGLSPAAALAGRQQLEPGTLR